MNFKGKYALVTGGGSGIGLAVAAALAGRGANVLITGRRASQLERACSSLSSRGIKVRSRSCDLSNAESIKRLVTWLGEQTQEMDFLVNNAGVYLRGAINEMEVETWDKTFEVNVRGIFLLVQGLIPFLKSPLTSIVNIASTLAYQTSVSTAAYAASKAAVVSLTKSMARELGPEGIRVNCICPGIVDTPAHDRYFSNDKEKNEFFEKVARSLPLRRIGKPKDIARTVLFLLSEESSWITGAVLPVDGGISIT